jgi:hypothetical protein
VCARLRARIQEIRDNASEQAAALSRTSDALTHYLREIVA